MAASDETVAVVQDIHDFVFEKLRQQLPFMKSEAVDDIVKDIAKTALDKIQAQEHAITATKAAFDFFSIPAELRNQIYEYVLVGEDTDRCWLANDSFPHYSVYRSKIRLSPEEVKVERENRNPWDGRRERLSTWPALLCVNNRVRKEALPIYFGQNTFKLCVGTYWSRGHECAFEFSLVPWLAMLGHERTKFVKDLVVFFDTSSEKDIRLLLPSLPVDSWTGLFDTTPVLTRQDVLNAAGLGGYGLPHNAIKVQYKGLKDEIIEISDDGTRTNVAPAKAKE